MSSEPATPKNDCVNDPGVSATRSLILVMRVLVIRSLLIVVSARGVSTTVFPKPNTASTGLVCITSRRSPLTVTSSKVSAGAADAAGPSAGLSAASDSCGTAPPSANTIIPSTRKREAAMEPIIIHLPDFQKDEPVHAGRHLGNSRVQESCAPHALRRVA